MGLREKLSKVAERKAKLHADLIVLAERAIAEKGVNELRARDLASEAGCSLGQIYNVFEDLDMLVLYVSLRTLERIDDVMKENERWTQGCSPSQIMVGLSHSYYAFVVENTNLWRTLFEHALPAHRELPDWIVHKQVDLLSHICTPLRQLVPKASEEKLLETAQLLFSAVHGVVNLSVDQRTTGLPSQAVKPQLEFLVDMFVKGVLAENG